MFLVLVFFTALAIAYGLHPNMGFPRPQQQQQQPHHENPLEHREIHMVSDDSCMIPTFTKETIDFIDECLASCQSDPNISEESYEKYFREWMANMQECDDLAEPDWEEYYNACQYNYARLMERFNAITEKLDSILEEYFPAPSITPGETD